MTFRRLYVIRITGAALLMSSCDLFGGLGTACDAAFRFGLSVYVKDSATGAWAASGARLFTDIGGTPVDTGTMFASAFPASRPDLDSLPLGGAGERAGVYRVRVQKPGYAEWVRTGVRVTADECHVRRTVLTAQLQAAR